MNAAVIVDQAQLIDVINLDQIQFDEQLRLQAVVDQFRTGVTEMRTLLEEEKAILHCPTSMGKDSTLVVLMAVEAYKQSIDEGAIEPSRPLILSTVDTGGESIPMRMYVSYARTRLIQYASKNGLNLYYDVVTPPLNDEYFVKFVGGQKLIPNATRRGDCSIILKVDPSERYLKNLLTKFGQTPQFKTYSKSKVICCVGSRELESNRRANNMRKQGLANKTASDLTKELQSESLGVDTFYKFAPIKDWSTDDVFDALRLSGIRPLKKVRGSSTGSIPAFLADFGLLLEIYGNGSNETCDISVGSNASSGCNGKARFGCVYCTMVAVTDHSSTAISELPRWSALGSKNALRVRDYLFRLSCDIDARALHARAYDPTTYNRVALQPNTLQPKYLEKMVRFASQLTLDSIKISSDFRALLKAGKESLHPGLADIIADENMPPKTKKAFIEMYKECVQDPKNLNYLFSENHALLLSFRWSIDGIGAAPYRPLAIWKALEKGEGWIPYPALNSEYEVKHGPLKLQSDKPLPEAVMMPILKNEVLETHVNNPIRLLDLWVRPIDFSDFYDEDSNCSISRVADNLVDVEVSYTTNYKLTDEKSNKHNPTFVAVDNNALTNYFIEYCAPEISAVKLNGLTVTGAARDKLIANGVLEEIEERFYTKVQNLRDRIVSQPIGCINNIQLQINALFPTTEVLKRKVQHLSKASLFCGYTSEASRKIEPTLQFTKRVTKLSKGKIIRGNTRLSFYPVVTDSRIHKAHKQVKTMLLPSFETHTQKTLTCHDASLLLDEQKLALENLLVSEVGIEQWKLVGGLEKALTTHDDYMATLIKKRHLRGYTCSDVRKYGGTHVAESMLAEGVVSISKTYWSQLQSILKRTQIFNDLGMYTFQSQSVKKVLSHPRAISMPQHRSDKALIMSRIRKMRNSQRIEFRKLAMSGCEALIPVNLELFKNTAKSAIDSVSYELNASILKLRFDTHEVTPVNRAATSSLWLSLQLDGITHVDHVISKVVTPTQFKSLKAQPAQYLSSAKLALETLGLLDTYIQKTIKDWAPLLEGLHSLVVRTDNTKESAICEYRTLIKTHSPVIMSDNDILQWWNPSLENMVSYLSGAIDTINIHNAHLRTIQSQISDIRGHALRQVTKKLSLEDKLSLMQKRHAA